MAVEKILEKAPLEKSPELVPHKPEQSLGPESRIEQIPAKVDKPREAAATAERSAVSAAVPASLAQDFQKRRAAAIDSILAEGLNEVFLKMSAQEQQAFKKKGEETVIKINELLSQTRVKVNKIISLIKAWLKMIPGVNKFFLEQEVKIKADRILKIKDKF
ncbi:MAG: hypothetical protein WC456_03940 [Patescibacteria group bacterium]